MSAEAREAVISTEPAEIQAMIRARKVGIGMTADQVRLSWGNPSDINVTVGSWGRHEQWVYPRQYLYFENGLLTSLQGPG